MEPLRVCLNTTIPDISLLIARDPGRKLQKSGTPRRVARRLSAAQIENLCTQYRQGAATRTLAEQYGVRTTVIAKLLREQSIPLRHQGLSAEQVALAAQLYSAGKPVAQVATTLGLHPSPVYDTLRRAGVEFRSAHESGRKSSHSGYEEGN